MNRRGLVRLALATALAAGLGAPALAQSERNSRLLPQAVAPVASPEVAPPPAAVPPPVVPTAAAAAESTPASDGAAPTVLPGAAASTFSPSPAAGSSTTNAQPIPNQTVSAPPSPAPRALPPAPRPATVTAAQPAAVAPTPTAAVTTTEAPSQPVAAVPARVRTPLPAVRVAASAEPAQAPAAAPASSTDPATESAAALDVLAEDAETVLSEAAETDAAAGTTPVIQDAAPDAAATANDALQVMARDAEALRAAAEQEQAALAVQQAMPRPAPRDETVVETTEVVAVVAEPPASPAAPVEPAADDAAVAAVEQTVVVEHATAPDGAAPVTTEAAHAAVDGAGPADAPAPPPPPTTAPDAPAHAPADTAPAATAEQAPIAVAAEPTVAAEAAEANDDRDGRPGGIRWIAGAGLPPPNPNAPLVAGEQANPAPTDTDGPSDEATLDTAAVTAEREVAPRVRRRPSTPPIAAPYELVRTLQAMQDDMAGGSTAALAAQRTLLQRMEEEFAGADPLVWQDRRNARALVAYTLGGGRPATLRRLLASETPPDGDAALMRGALAYVEGDEATARKYLTDIDPTSLPASLGGQLALAQAALAVGEDPKKAMLLLDTARLLAPGTLVEEGALRRQIFVASELNDLARFEALSGQYLRRFRRSVYAGNFRRRFAAALSRMEFLDDPAQFHRLDDMLAETDPEARRELYLVVAQAAVNEGKTTVAATAAERALASAPPGSVDEARGRLYRGAALAVTSDGLDAAMSELGKVNRGGLPRTDAALLQAATETAMLIRTAAAAAGAAHTLPVEAAPDDETPSATVTRARDAIAAIDTLLEQAQ